MCKWTYDESEDMWTTECGEAWTFNEGGPTENSMSFCFNCGKKIQEVVEE